MSKFPNPEWIDDVKWCSECKGHHPADRDQCVYHDVPLVEVPRWRPTEKSGVHVHDDAPCCKVEIVHYQCEDCAAIQYSYFRVADCKECSGEAASEGARKEHSICRSCKKVMTPIKYWE